MDIIHDFITFIRFPINYKLDLVINRSLDPSLLQAKITLASSLNVYSQNINISYSEIDWVLKNTK